MTVSSTSGTIAWLPFLGSAFGALFALESLASVPPPVFSKSTVWRRRRTTPLHLEVSCSAVDLIVSLEASRAPRLFSGPLLFLDPHRKQRFQTRELFLHRVFLRRFRFV